MFDHLVLANIDRAGDHAIVLAVLAGIAAVGGLVFGLIRLVGRSRARRTSSERGPGAREPGA
jgi:hypothetical protein